MRRIDSELQMYDLQQLFKALQKVACELLTKASQLRLIL